MKKQKNKNILKENSKKVKGRRLEEIEKAIDSRTPIGVPEYALIDVFKELGYGKRELNRFHKWMFGQTCGLVGDIPIYYKSDLFRFLAHNCDDNVETLD